MAAIQRSFVFQFLRASTAGASTPSRADRGLYHGVKIGSGNNVSHAENRTRRTWKPNVHNKRIWSDTLDRMVNLKVTSKALKSIDKAGGLDNYLLYLQPKLRSQTAENLRNAILDLKEIA